MAEPADHAYPARQDERPVGRPLPRCPRMKLSRNSSSRWS